MSESFHEVNSSDSPDDGYLVERNTPRTLEDWQSETELLKARVQHLREIGIDPEHDQDGITWIAQLGMAIRQVHAFEIERGIEQLQSGQ